MIITNTEYKQITNEDYTIKCESFETRTGWGHIVKIYDSNYNTIGYAKINYYNRTWERYRYQSAILAALRDAIETRIQNLKYENNIKRLTKQQRDNFVINDKVINELMLIMEECK